MLLTHINFTAQSGTDTVQILRRTVETHFVKGKYQTDEARLAMINSLAGKHLVQ
jgi:hypothetical protein